MELAREYSCLGFDFLGMCSYNPAQPQHIYFDIGSAIAALGFILAIQQLLRPIYQFRLRAYGVELWHLTLVIFLGFVSVFISALTPNIPISHDQFWGYPLFWELLGGALIAGAYGFTAYLILRPTRIRDFNLITFIRSAATLLSEAKDEDRVKFANDLATNITSLFKYAVAWDKAEGHESSIEFERLREQGEELVIRGRPPISAFYRFTHRKALEKASFAGTFFRILADVKFCSTLVCECPWSAALIVNKIGDNRLHVDQAESFIRQLATQAIINEESMMAREVGYDGFGQAPLLSQSLFSDWFILKYYRPLNNLRFKWDGMLSEKCIARLNAASEMMMETALKNGDYWGAEYMFDVDQAYESLSNRFGWSKEEKRPDYSYPDVTWHSGIRQLYRMLSEDFPNLEPERIKPLFIKEKDQYRNDLVGTVANIVFESLSSIANTFDGHSGRFWTHAIGTFMDIYPFHDSEPEGMNPLQQQLAVKLVDKLKDNMEGWYPAISRVLLAVIGPYESHPKVKTRTAYVILKDAVYKELQRLPELYKKKPEKIADYFPENVEYDPKKNTLTHTYSGGDKVVTNLNKLKIPEVDLLDESNWAI